MANVLLVVNDSAIPTTSDAEIKTRLEALNNVCQYISASATEATVMPTGGAAIEGVLLCESCSSATLGTKYSTKTCPVVLWEPNVADDHGLLSAALTNTVTGDIDITDATHPAAGGRTGALTVSGAADNIAGFLIATAGAGCVPYAEASGGAFVAAATWASGVAQGGGGNTTGRRGVCGWGNPTNTALGYDMLVGLFNFVMNVPDRIRVSQSIMRFST